MAVDAYIKNAVSQLRSAAVELQRQAGSLQNEFDGERRQREGDINKNKLKMSTLGTRVAVEGDTDLKMKFEREMLQAKQAIDEHNRAIDDRKSQINQAADAKRSLASRLESVAGQLDSLGSSGAATQ